MIEYVIPDFNIDQIARSGQCFRFRREGEGRYSLIAGGKWLDIEQNGETVRFSCAENEFEGFWRDYFDLNADYGRYKSKVAKRDAYLRAAVETGSGLRILRQEYRFNGYIHAKAIPGTSPELVQQLGLLADRLSVNIELPSQSGLQLLAPDKTKDAILRPMGQIRDGVAQSKAELVKYKHAPAFAPAGQSTQLIVGATSDNDRHILHLTESLYRKYRLKRVFYSAYVPVVENSLLPALDTKPPLLREHRLYQADWLLRFYGFRAEELLDEAHPDFDQRLDPKSGWAVAHLDQFPVEIMRADLETLLRVPGIGPVSARRILSARRQSHLRFEDLKKLGVVVKRAQFFITCGGRMRQGLRFSPATLAAQLEQMERGLLPESGMEQLSLFDHVG